MEYNSTCFANPKPVKKQENPGVMVSIDGRITAVDDLIYAQAVSTYLALRWVEDLLKENRRMENSIKEALAALPVTVLREYVQETDMGDDDSNDEE